jgi:hypothetical protein
MHRDPAKFSLDRDEKAKRGQAEKNRTQAEPADGKEVLLAQPTDIVDRK